MILPHRSHAIVVHCSMQKKHAHSLLRNLQLVILFDCRKQLVNWLDCAKPTLQENHTVRNTLCATHCAQHTVCMLQQHRSW
jgi:hypothetical protein